VPNPSSQFTEGIPEPLDLEAIAIPVALAAAGLVRARYGSAKSIGTKSSATDVVTQTDLDTETLIRSMLEEATPGCGFVGEEGGTSHAGRRLQWVIDPLDGTVNFLYAVPIFAISIAAAVDGEFVAGVVVDVMRNEVFSAHLGGGSRRDGQSIITSQCAELANALVATGFSYTSRLRALQGELMQKMLPLTRDIRCFGSAALQACWVGCGRIDAYFERDIKIWDWAAGTLIAQEAGAVIDFPCPENDGLVLVAPSALMDAMRSLTAST
jgi:myo-inositol-1(or 4)-monophosphatase